MYTTPAITNYALACEIYLKTLLLYENKKAKRQHALDKLFASLSDEVRRDINYSTFQKYPEYDVLSGKILTDAFGIELIKREAKAFETWRYSYEYNDLSCDIGYFVAFSEALRDKCCFLLNRVNWETYCNLYQIDLNL